MDSPSRVRTGAFAPGNCSALSPRMVATSPKNEPPTASEIFEMARKKALRGGISGAIAMGVNVTALMWMRTTINFQYKYGYGTFEAFGKLYADGGILRFYRGYFPALLQGPLSRFGDTAANEGALAFLNHHPLAAGVPVAVKTVVASACAAGFRVFLMPIDCLKTTLQVEGRQGLSLLGNKIRVGGPLVLWHGWEGAIGATFVGHYPWFFTRNQMMEILPKYDRKKEFLNYLGVSAIIGFCASAVSDTCSNSIRVLKTSKQTSEVPVTYVECAQKIIAKDGITGLMFRGLGTKIISNGMQGLLFNVLWKYISDLMAESK